jgi:hypothetical protein
VRRDKTAATWLAVVGGTLGLHRFYLHGVRDLVGWLYPLPSLAGLAGVVRMANLGQDDRVAWLLIPLLGLTISAAMLSAIVYALTPDERWAARFGQHARPTRWGPVLGAITALLLGAGVLLGTIAFGIQKFFEWQLAPVARAAAAVPVEALPASFAGRSRVSAADALADRQPAGSRCTA